MSSPNSLLKIVSSDSRTPIMVDVQSLHYLFKKSTNLPPLHVRHLYKPSPWSDRVTTEVEDYRRIHGPTARVPGLGVFEQIDPEAVIACHNVRNWIRKRLLRTGIKNVQVDGDACEWDFRVKGFRHEIGFDTLLVRFRSNVCTIECMLLLKDKVVKLPKIGYAESRHFITKAHFETEIYRLMTLV